VIDGDRGGDDRVASLSATVCVSVLRPCERLAPHLIHK